MKKDLTEIEIKAFVDELLKFATIEELFHSYGMLAFAQEDMSEFAADDIDDAFDDEWADFDDTFASIVADDDDPLAPKPPPPSAIREAADALKPYAIDGPSVLDHIKNLYAAASAADKLRQRLIELHGITIVIAATAKMVAVDGFQGDSRQEAIDAIANDNARLVQEIKSLLIMSTPFTKSTSPLGPESLSG